MSIATSDQGSRQSDILAPLFAIIEEGLDVLEEERTIFLTGEYERIEGITKRKLDVLERLESVIANLPRSAVVINSIKRLITASKRNEQLIQAARQGLSHARRRITAIAETRRGVVAYAEDGTRIKSRADLLKEDKSA
jgi:flagellar biosynthesis/type III secretory pathway chaperone